MITLEEMMDRLPPERREKVERRAKKLIAEEMSRLRQSPHSPQPQPARYADAQQD